MAVLVIALVAALTPATARGGDPCTPSELIVDGTFEAGAPWPAWTIQTSTNFGTPLCSVFSCGVGGGSADPFEGQNWAWFGGIDQAETSTAGQSVIIPAGGRATLTFQLRVGTVAPPFEDVLNVRVDGNVIRTFTEPETPEDFYSRRTINLDAFADGASHTILFEYIHTGGNLSNFTVDNVSLARRCSAATTFDYDGDQRSDISVFRPTDGNWYLQRSSEGFIGVNFGISTDRIVPADYDADGKTDIAVYRPSEGNWYISNSSNGSITVVSFGIAEDLPAPADYDGDGKADIAVFRPSVGTWFIANSSNGSFTIYQFGQAGDRPSVGDFDGDGRSDIAIFRPSTSQWYRVNSSDESFAGQQFGEAGDRITPADFDGDSKTDIAVFRPSTGTWFIQNSTTGGFSAFVWGSATDVPAAGDFDGDGRANVAVFRPDGGFWYVLNSDLSFTTTQFGQNGDQATHSAFN